MATLLTFLCTVVIAMNVSLASRKPVELTLVFTIGALILICWLAGFFLPISTFRPAIWITAFGLVVNLGVKRREAAKFLSPGLVLFLACAASAYVATRPLMLLSWDEYSHWGQVAKFISTTQTYPKSGEILFDSYPFGTAIWQILIGGGEENDWIFAQIILKSAAFLTLFVGISWGRPLIYAILSLFVLSTSVMFIGLGGPGDILIDAPLGLWTAAALVIYFRSDRGLASILMIAVICGALPIFKEIGLLFAAFVTAVMVVDQTVTRVFWPTRTQVRKIAVCLLPAAFALGVNTVRVAMLGPREGFGFKLTWDAVKSALHTEHFNLRILETVSNIGLALSNWAFAGADVTILQISGTILAVLVIATAVVRASQVVSIFSFVAVSIAGYVLYVGFLFVLYLFSFSSFEGTHIASFHRYSNSFLLIVWMVAAGMAVGGVGTYFSDILRTAALVLMVFLGSSTLSTRLVASFDPTQGPSFSTRQEVDRLVASAPPEALGGSKVYVIWNGSNGEEFYISMFRLAPSRTNRECFSLGAMRDESDMWSCNIRLGDLRAQLKDYSFVLLGRSDEEFAASYRMLFSAAPSPGWYVVNRDDRGDVTHLSPAVR